MRIATWNVNSITARLPRLLDWLATREPDVVAVQETKVGPATFPHDALAEVGYQAHAVSEGRWNGVAVLSRVGVEPVADRLADYPEARYAVADCAGLRVVSVYVPNGRSLADAQFAYKLQWLAALRASLDDIPAGQPIAIMGDFNVARRDEDVWNIASFAHSTHVTPAERAGFEQLIDWGLVDVPARPGKNDRPFTYWDYRAGMFHKDLGMRIDYVLLSPQVRIVDAFVDREARKGKLPSDHAPIVVDLELP